MYLISSFNNAESHINNAEYFRPRGYAAARTHTPTDLSIAKLREERSFFDIRTNLAPRYTQAAYLLSPGERRPLLATGGKSSSRRRVRRKDPAISSAINHSRGLAAHRHTEGHHSRGSSGRVNGTMRNYPAPHLPAHTARREAFLLPRWLAITPLECSCRDNRIGACTERTTTSSQLPLVARVPAGLTRAGDSPSARLGKLHAVHTVPPLIRDGRESGRIQITGICFSVRARRVSRKLSRGCHVSFFSFFLPRSLFVTPVDRDASAIDGGLVDVRLSITAYANERGTGTNGGF